MNGKRLFGFVVCLLCASQVGFSGEKKTSFFCESKEYELSVTLPKAEALLTETVSGKEVSDFVVSDYRSKRWKSGEWYVSFRFSGIEAWENEVISNQGRVSIAFDKVKDNYYAKFYFIDKESRELQLYPRFVWSCVAES